MGTSISTQTVLKLKVDYRQPVENLVQVGKYDWSDSDVNSKNFPTSGNGTEELEAVLVGFGCRMESEEVIARVGDAGLCIVERRLPRLLTIGIQHPDEQRKGSIVDLGSVWCDPGGDRHVAYLWGDISERGLGLDWFGSRWRGSCLFLAFRKEDPWNPAPGAPQISPACFFAPGGFFYAYLSNWSLRKMRVDEQLRERAWLIEFSKPT